MQPAALLLPEVLKRQIVTSVVGTEYFLRPEDDNYWLRTRSDAPVTIVIPPQAEADFEPYTLVTIERAGDGPVIFEGGGAVVINTAQDLAIDVKFGVMMLKRVDVDEWTLVNYSGDPPRIVPVDYFWASNYFADNEVLFRADIQQDFIVPLNFDGWQARVLTPPSNFIQFGFYKNGNLIGNVNFGAGETVGTFGFCAVTSLDGALFEIRAPSPSANGATGFSVTLLGI